MEKMEVKTAWLATSEGFRKVEVLEKGLSFRKIRFMDKNDNGELEEVILPPEGVPFEGQHPALYEQEAKPEVWSFKGHSLKIRDFKEFADPAKAEALWKANTELDEQFRPRPYVFQPHTAQVVDGVIEGDHQLLVGHKGVGKTSVVLQIAAAIKQPVIRLNFTGQISVSDLVGSVGFGPGGTTWNDGPLITAMRMGAWLLMDEFDFGDPSCMALFHSICEKRPSYCLKENNGEVVIAHKDFRVFATGNSINGDGNGDYVGTQAMNIALLDRFAGHGRIVEVKAMTAKQERQMLKLVLPTLPDRLAKKAANFAAKIRAEQIKHFSTRELINYCKKLMQYKDPVKAANLTFLPLVDNLEMRRGIEAALKAIFGNRIIVGRYLNPAAKAPEAVKAEAPITVTPTPTPTPRGELRTASQVTDTKEIEAIWNDYKGNGGKLTYEQIDAKYGLKPSNGHHAWIIVKKHKAKLDAVPAPEDVVAAAS